ncbi:hypothetical protein FYZ48_10930 [Gimesia chilikensis]|uniref:hypothetical protein n=1 Tax=Gimesia chilikensis TaxID=2605989 RepID=UPI0011EBE044|nr:hypothetical protein [Gimesia chilikensis]KAA0139150.1 hypothetical protein FYZ48_10930 [Gimesia chilikensis]
MNEFYEDAAYFANRCVSHVAQNMPKDSVIDAGLYFAFCVERLFKGILWDIDKRSVLEDGKFENCIAVLYRDRLIPPALKNIEHQEKKKKTEYKTINFKEAMFRASNFSQITYERIGVFTKLFSYRGIIAHRTLNTLDTSSLRTLLQEHFQPIIRGYIDEHNLDEKEFFTDEEIKLSKLAKEISDSNSFESGMEKLLDKHRQIWAKRKENQDFLDKAKQITEINLKDEEEGTYFHESTECPACGNVSSAECTLEWEYEGPIYGSHIVGAYVSGLKCEYCDLVLDDYEQFDYLRSKKLLSDIL